MSADPTGIRIVHFPETRIAVVEHLGPPETEHVTALRLVTWRKANGLPTDRHRAFGIHYDDPRTTPPSEHRVDFAVECDRDIPGNPQGVIAKVIPAGRCAVARHLGSREHIAAAVYLYEVWLPSSGELLRDFPIFFHYVNVGPHLHEQDLVTDVYLPLK